jgi:tetratricopeptide (TPR) repeat protein/lysophospholipase L1-like esterase
VKRNLALLTTLLLAPLAALHADPAEARKQFTRALEKALTGTERAAAHIGIGGAFASEKYHSSARAEFEKALAIQGITHEQSAQALLMIGSGYIEEKKDQSAIAVLEKASSQKGISNPTRLEISLLLGQTLLKYPLVYSRAREVFTDILKSPEITSVQKIAAETGQVKVLMGLKEYAEARGLRESLAANEALTPSFRLSTRVSIGKTLMLERNFGAARIAFAKALTMPEVSDAIKADIQLQIGLCYYDEQDYERAKPELMKVLEMPSAGVRPPDDGGRIFYLPSREAMLRLRLRNLISDDNKVLKVLFIGSSHTYREDIPGLVTKIAESAPADKPRIIAGDFVRMGTGINTFWNAGDAPDTARGVISAEPWDAVVFETFYTMKSDDILKYGTLFADLIRSRKARPVLYESPIAQASVYPDAYQQFHDNNVALANALKVPLAPSVHAWMQFLGPHPTAEQFGTVYADWIHAAPKGAYMTACSIYSALTGFSPVGLAHPNLSDADAAALQQAAWKAFQESNPNPTQ